jgi:hypothetical protein
MFYVSSSRAIKTKEIHIDDATLPTQRNPIRTDALSLSLSLSLVSGI